MRPPEELSDVEESILLALWKLRGFGGNPVREDAVKAGLAMEIQPQSWAEKVANLHRRGFLETATKDGHNVVSLTPLGFSILRKIEEDRLQELK
jgi:Mn-dependent DtxR family transcriptional regulator